MEEQTKDIPPPQRETTLWFESSHLFKLPSQVDPRPDKKGKAPTGTGGFLEGEIQLPLGISDMTVDISTHPSFTFPAGKVAKYPGVEEFSPCMIYPIIKPKGKYDWGKMPIPSPQHWKLELQIEGDSVSIRKNFSKLDVSEGRIPPEELTPEFEILQNIDIGPDRKLRFGEDANKLKVKILYPKTEARSTEGEVTVKEMLKQRKFPPTDELAIEFCEGQNKKRLKECKLLAVIRHWPSSGEFVTIGRGLSRTIKDSRSLLDMHDVSPNVSCSAGGAKIIMISESSLAKDILPEFQLWKEDTNRRIEDREEEKLLINNKIPDEDIRVQGNWLRFRTSPQPNLAEISSKGYIFKLVARRINDGAVSGTFDFTYTQHDSCLVEDPGGVFTCIQCYHSDKSKIPETIKAKPKMRKRKPIEEEEPGTSYLEEIESENLPRGKMAKMMSPDSGMGDSPHGRRRDSGDSIGDLTQGRRESSDLINDNFENVLTSGSGPEVEELERNIPADQLIGTDMPDPGAEQQQLIKLIDSMTDDVQFDGAVPRSSPPSANIASSSGKPKSQRPKDPLPEDPLSEDTLPKARLHSSVDWKTLKEHQRVLRRLWTATKNFAVRLFVFLMLMLLRLAGEAEEGEEDEECTVKESQGPGMVFEKLISGFSPIPMFLAILCFLPYDWVPDFLRRLWTATKNFAVNLLVFLMLMLLRLAGESIVEGGLEVVFGKLISVFSPFPIFLAILCILPNDLVPDFCTEQKIPTLPLYVLLAAMLTVLSLRVFK